MQSAAKHYIHGPWPNNHIFFADTCNQQPNITSMTPGQNTHKFLANTCNQQPNIKFTDPGQPDIHKIFSLTHAISSKTLTSWPLAKQPNITFMALAQILINVSLTHAISSQTLNSRLLAKLIIIIALADTCNQQPSIIFKALDRINIIFIAAHANSKQTLTSWPQANKIRISSTTKY